MLSPVYSCESSHCECTIVAYGQYDYIEYAGIWVITVVMTVWGMTAALLAGVIAALSTYAVQVSNMPIFSPPTASMCANCSYVVALYSQSINYQNPIRQILSAATLRSSDWNRCATARGILENDTTGRSRILIFQLQGHVSFLLCLAFFRFLTSVEILTINFFVVLRRYSLETLLS